MSGRDGVAAAVRAGAAAAALEFDWGRIFAIDFDGCRWSATRRDGTGTPISALTPDDLAVRMRAASGPESVVLAGLFLWLLRRRQAACRRCPHDRDSHRPYIPGGSRPGFCGACQCYQYRPERAWTLALAFLRERPPPVTPDVLRQHPVPFPVRDTAGYDDKTHLDIPLARPYAGDLDEARLRAPRQRGGPPW